MNIKEKVERLAADRELLKADLTKTLDKDEKLAIRQQIIATTNEITALYTLLPKAEDGWSFMCIPTTLFRMAGCDAAMWRGGSAGFHHVPPWPV